MRSNLIRKQSFIVFVVFEIFGVNEVLKGELHPKATSKGMKGNLKKKCFSISVFKINPPVKEN